MLLYCPWVPESAVETIMQENAVMVEYMETVSAFYVRYNCEIKKIRGILLPRIYVSIPLRKGR